MKRNTLKYLTIVAMTLDHLGAYLVTNPYLYLILRFIGRITFPIMCFFIAQGYKYTTNKKRYALRLFIFALISQIPWTLLKNNTLLTLDFFTNLNTIFTLLLAYLFLFTLNSPLNTYLKIPLLIFLFFSSLLCDYHIVGIFYVLCFYYLEKKHLMYLPLVFLGAYLLNTLLMPLIKHASLDIFSPIINLGIFLTIPLLLKYNYQKEKKSLFNKYFFYIYYPLHLSIIFLFTLII